MTQATYEFSYAMKRLCDAIQFVEQGDTVSFSQIRIWANHVEAAYKADIAAEQELTHSANEGAKLLHSLATGGETSVLSRLDNGVDAVDAQRWQDEGSKVINLNGYTATATASWRERHLNEGA